jgi:ligand-binding sensor domain-containing protein
MKLKPTLLLLLLNLLYGTLFAQNIFSQKVEGCNPPHFCLDCGDPKAAFDPADFASIIERINKTFKFGNSKGAIMFQVMVDSAGQGCVLSHTDASHSQVTKGLIGYLNVCKWMTAMQNGKAVSSSINVLFTVADGKMTGKADRVDFNAFKTNLRTVGEPTIYNKQYQYTNPSLNTYEFKSWNKDNSPLPGNISQHCLIDKNGVLWYNTLDGVFCFDGNTFKNLDDQGPPFKSASAYAMFIDKKNNIWINADKALYQYDNTKWTKYDSTQTNVSWTYNMVSNVSGEVFFTTNKGLVSYKEGKWELLNSDKIKELPSNRINYAYRDKKGRLWIGTFSGSIMIDKEGKITCFNNLDTPLKDVCITNIVEDENDNIYFALYAIKKHGADVDEEGLAVLMADGKWMHYNDKNSGMPSNHINSLFYDSFEKVLWISSHAAGLVRFDLKDGWENYHNKNSGVPSYDVYQITSDSNGVKYVSTYNGLLMIRKK